MYLESLNAPAVISWPLTSLFQPYETMSFLLVFTRKKLSFGAGMKQQKILLAFFAATAQNTHLWLVIKRKIEINTGPSSAKKHHYIRECPPPKKQWLNSTNVWLEVVTAQAAAVETTRDLWMSKWRKLDFNWNVFVLVHAAELLPDNLSCIYLTASKGD